MMSTISSSVDNISTSARPPGRVLRPMIVAKQLDLPEGPTGADMPAALPMPRTQLTRELEKYSRPVSAAATCTTGSSAVQTPVCTTLKNVFASL